MDYVSTHDLTRRSTNESTTLILNNIVSTHDLTRRSTGILSQDTWRKIVSTHDLTRRSTSARAMVDLLPMCFNSRPHKEIDQINSFP